MNKINDWEDVPLDTQLSNEINDWEDVPLENEGSPSVLESTGRGILQGISAGFADEATAGLEALFTDKPYRQARDESRANYKAAEEANPVTYMAGDIGAGVATGLLTGGAGLVGSLGKTGIKQGVKELAKLGAKEGAAFGLGQSEADLTEGDVGGATRDVALGAGVGGALGAGVPTLGKGLGKIGSEAMDLFKGTNIGSNLTDAFKLSKEGQHILGKKGKELTIKQSEEAAEQLLNQFKRQKKEANKKITMALDSNKTPMNLSRELRDIEGNLLSKSKDYSEEDMKRIERLLDSRKVDHQLPGKFEKTGELSEINVKGLDKAKATMDKSISKAKAEAEALGQDVNFTDPEVIPEANILQSLQTTRNELGEQVPKVRQVDVPSDEFQAGQSLIDYKPGDIVKKYQDMNLQDLQNLKKAFQSAGYDEGREGIAKSQLQNATREVDALIESKLSPKYKSAYETGNQQWKDSAESADFFNELKPDFNPDKAKLDFADKIRKPSTKRSGYVNEVEERLANPNPELMQKIEDVGVKSRLEKSTEGSSLLGFIPTPSATATYAGVGFGKAASTLKTPINTVSKILGASDDSLKSFATRMSQANDPARKAISENIMTALNGADKRDRLLWSLSRQPAFRQLIEEEGLDELGVDRNSTEQSLPQHEVPQTSPIDKNKLKEELLNRFKNR